MAKKAFVYDGTNWVDIAQSTADLSTYQKSNRTGLNVVVPTGATNGTVGANGAVTIGSAVTSVTVSGAFSATYDNYKIILNGGTSSAQAAISLRLGASTSAYYGNYIYGNITDSTPRSAPTSGSIFTYAGGCDIGLVSANIELTSPFLAKTTSIFASMVNYGNNRGTFAGDHEVGASYTDFTLLPSSGTMTGGTIRIYGYNNN